MTETVGAAPEADTDSDAKDLSLNVDDLYDITFHSLEITNFLSYKRGRLEFDSFCAMVGANASGKSNAVSALKLLREIPIYGLSVAVARRGGFDQLRHRSSGHPYDPALRLAFRFKDEGLSYYELRLGAVRGKRYEVKSEKATVHIGRRTWGFDHQRDEVRWLDPRGSSRTAKVAPGQSALGTGDLSSFIVADVLRRIQIVEVDPSRVGDLQEPSSTREFEPDGSNTVSIYEDLSPRQKSELVDLVSAIVPGIVRIEVRALADKQTMVFVHETNRGRREFLAKQMSDGTLRAFSILLAALHKGPGDPRRTSDLLVIEEPEIAIHLGALRSLVDILQQLSSSRQILITTHSADIIDAVPVESLRVVNLEDGESRISAVAPHTREVVRSGLIGAGALLRSDSLDPE